MGRVCNRTPDLRYYLCMYLVDMRKQFNGLQGIVTQEFGRYITSNEAFVYVGKRGTILKILHREGNGMTLYVRKLTSIITWRNVEFATEIEFTYETATEGEKTIMIPDI